MSEYVYKTLGFATDFIVQQKSGKTWKQVGSASSVPLAFQLKANLQRANLERRYRVIAHNIQIQEICRN